MKVCVIGCGTLAHARSNTIGALEDFEICVTIDPDLDNARSLANEYWDFGHKTRGLISLDDPAKYDLAIIQSPNGVHRSCAEPFINANIPVVIEKPLAIAATDLDWFEEMENQGKWICGSYNSRFSHEVNVAAMNAMADVACGGRIVTLSSTKYRHRQPNYYQDGWHGTMAMDGGVLAQQAIHCIDLVCWIADTPPKRVAALGYRRRHEIECEDTGTALIDFGDFVGTVSGTTAAGRNGMAALDVITTRGVYGDQAWGWDDGADLLWDKIRYALQAGDEPPVTVKSMLPSLRVLHAAYLSMEDNGAWVDVGKSHPRLGVG